MIVWKIESKFQIYILSYKSFDIWSVYINIVKFQTSNNDKHQSLQSDFNNVKAYSHKS